MESENRGVKYHTTLIILKIMAVIKYDNNFEINSRLFHFKYQKETWNFFNKKQFLCNMQVIFQFYHVLLSAHADSNLRKNARFLQNLNIFVKLTTVFYFLQMINLNSFSLVFLQMHTHTQNIYMYISSVSCF